jgi:hypothetical protein
MPCRRCSPCSSTFHCLPLSSPMASPVTTPLLPPPHAIFFVCPSSLFRYFDIIAILAPLRFR